MHEPSKAVLFEKTVGERSGRPVEDCGPIGFGEAIFVLDRFEILALAGAVAFADEDAADEPVIVKIKCAIVLLFFVDLAHHIEIVAILRR